jgi:hypothetical protein
MQRAVVVIGSVLLVLTLTSRAMASTSQTVSMTFAEPSVNKDCPVTDGFCGSGWVIPLGHATETIAFNAGCGGSCDLRTINFSSGSIFLDERFSDPQCPGSCQKPAGPNELVLTGKLHDVITGGTGAFEGTSGTLSGTVRAAGKTSQIKLAGTLVLAS